MYNSLEVDKTSVSAINDQEGYIDAATTGVKSNKDYQDNTELKNQPIHKKRHFFTFALFLMLGCAELLNWNTLLASLGSASSELYNHKEPIMNEITTTYSCVILVITLFFIYYNVVYVSVTQAGLGISIINSVLYIVASYTTFNVAYILYFIMAVVMAFATALIGSSGFGYAGRFYDGYAGAMSAGLGLSGVLSFFIWVLARYGLFQKTTEGLRNAFLFTNLINIIFFCAVIVLLWYFNSLSWVKEATIQAQQADVEKKLNTLDDTSIMTSIKKTWFLTIFVFFHMFLTLFCFPNVGPIHWNLEEANALMIIGTFQIGDLIGRYFPNIFPFLMLKEKPLIYGVCSRSIIVIFVYLSAYLKTNLAFQSFAFKIVQMAFLAVTNGWLSTVGFVRMMDRVDTDVARGHVGSITLLAIYFGIALGQLLSLQITKHTL